MSNETAAIEQCDKAQYVLRTEQLLTMSRNEREQYALEMELIEERLRPFRVDLTRELPEPKPLVAINNRCVCSRGNISAIVGESKSRKTFLCTALVASAIAFPYPDRDGFETVTANYDRRVVWLDTEQGEQHVRKVITRINHISGATRVGREIDERVEVYSLREYKPRERMAVLADSIRLHAPDIVVVDGISDLMHNTNDLEESDRIVGDIMALSTLYNCHIICVLHTNPGSDKARGHIGSALQRKAETVIYVHRVGETSIVEPQFCRNEPFERFAFKVDEQGIPALCELPMESIAPDQMAAVILRDMYGGAVERQVLTKRLVSDYGLSQDAARMRISRAIRNGNIVADGDILRITDSSI